MKKYKVEIKDKATKEVLFEKEEMTITKKWLMAKYYGQYRFSVPPVTIHLTRLKRKLSIQLMIPD